MALRDEIENDPRAMEMPLAFLKFAQTLSAERWNKLLVALKNRDEIAAADVLGIKPEEAVRQFRLIKERAKEVFEKHPDVLDLTKGR